MNSEFIKSIYFFPITNKEYANIKIFKENLNKILQFIKERNN